MFFDARQVPEGALLRSDVCVIGGGVAGITLALEFERLGMDCIMLESGGFKADDATRDLYRGENVGHPSVFSDGCRSRFLGGSSNCWGGWCGPLREQDLERRDYVPDSGWPLSLRELQPYYERAHSVLRMGPINYDIGYWVGAINRKDVRRIPLPSGRVEEVLSQFSSPSRFGVIYRENLKRAKSIRAGLYANVVEVETDSLAQRVLSVLVKTLSGRSFRVEARQFVLACGGIDNARLLLVSNKVQAAGLGNAYDLVGRYFADHPRLTLGKARLKPQWKQNKLYDQKFHYLNRAVSANGTFVSAQFSIARKVQEREGLLNALMWFSSVFSGEGTGSAEALIRMKHRINGKAGLDYGQLARDLALLARQPINTASVIAARVLQPERLIRGVNIDVICEPSPNRDSRVTLSNVRDQLGMPRPRLDWRLGEQIKRTFDRSIAIFAEELLDAGVAEVDVSAKLEGREWPDVGAKPWYYLGTWHHMGTTRMHDSPRHGVVDGNCKVHGVANLYIAGSSVFPTYGANFPTFTIVALGLRLADHLAEIAREPLRTVSQRGVERGLGAPTVDASSTGTALRDFRRA